MKSVAIIPLRKESKGIPGKNKKKLLGRPLYQWCLSEAIFSNLDEIYVFTDDEEIIQMIEQEYGWSPKVKALLRSKKNATDGASTEEAMLEFAQVVNYDFEIICLLQATSPLTNRNDINRTLAKVESEKYDSALTVVKAKRFIWNEQGESLNYDFMNRPKRQDFDGLWIENGAVYATNKKQFLSGSNRLGGNIAIVEMPEDSLTEIDEICDFYIVEKLLQNRLAAYKKSLRQIKLLVLDVDGVFTDGTVNVSADGEFSKSFSLRDGMGLELLKNSGVEVVVMTSENSQIVEKRMQKLKVTNLYMAVKDKFSRLEKVLKTKNIERNQVAYIGDDINDLSNLCSVAWGICPNNAIPQIKELCDLVLNYSGGDMAIREAVEFIIKYNQRFN